MTRPVRWCGICGARVAANSHTVNMPIAYCHAHADTVSLDRVPEVARPEIVRLCARCGVTQKDVDENCVIISPLGIAHVAYCDTAFCDPRLDATGPEWWWPL